MSEAISRIFITGCAGFIGSHLAEALLRQGRQIIGLDNFDPYYPRLLKERNLAAIKKIAEFPFFEGDIRDNQLLAQILAKHKPDAVVHIAALAGVRPSVAAPDRYMDVNVTGTARLLEAVRRANIKRLIFASSSSVYGGANTLPFSEDQPIASPLSPYAASKIAGEALCHTYHHLYKMPTIILRFFTVYGPRQRPDLAIRKFTECILAGQPIPLFGDGTSSRDYTYIDDVVRGIIAALDSHLAWAIINLGSHQPVTLNQLVETLQQLLGKPAPIEYLPPQQGDMPHTYADIRRARELLGWKPQISLEEGLQRFVQWHMQTQHNGN